MPLDGEGVRTHTVGRARTETLTGQHEARKIQVVVRHRQPSPILRRLCVAALCAALGGVTSRVAAEPPPEPGPGAQAEAPVQAPDAVRKLRQAHDKLREAQADLQEAQVQLKAAAEEAEGQARAEFTRARDKATGAMHELRQMWRSVRDKLGALEREINAKRAP